MSNAETSTTTTQTKEKLLGLLCDDVKSRNGSVKADSLASKAA
jgi:hypothetical protein